MQAVALFKGKDTYNLDIEIAIGEDGKPYMRRVKSNNYTASMSFTRWKLITNQLIVMVGDTIEFSQYNSPFLFLLQNSPSHVFPALIELQNLS